MEKINSLEESLHSKTEETTATKKKRAKIEKRLKKVMEQNREHMRKNTNLCRTYDIARVENEQL